MLIKINAKSVHGDVKNRIDQALLAGRSVVITYERSGEKDIVKLMLYIIPNQGRRLSCDPDL